MIFILGRERERERFSLNNEFIRFLWIKSKEVSEQTANIERTIFCIILVFLAFGCANWKHVLGINRIPPGFQAVQGSKLMHVVHDC